MPKPNTKNDSPRLSEIVRMFAEIADDENETPEHRKQARAIIRAYADDADGDTEARVRASARPALRLVGPSHDAPTPPPAAAAPTPGLTFQQRAALDRL